jgi:hypothetical protein
MTVYLNGTRYADDGGSGGGGGTSDTVLEDFERTDPLADYSGTVADHTIQSSVSVSGKALHRDAATNQNVYVVRDNPTETIQAGDTAQARVYASSNTSNGANPQLLFFASHDSNGVDGYDVYYDEGETTDSSSTLYFCRLDNTSITIINSVTATRYTDRFVTLEAQPASDGAHSASLIVDGTVEASVSINGDTTYTSGSYGWGSRRVDAYSDNLKVKA